MQTELEPTLGDGLRDLPGHQNLKPLVPVVKPIRNVVYLHMLSNGWGSATPAREQLVEQGSVGLMALD
jgi:hypothetical protein